MLPGGRDTTDVDGELVPCGTVVRCVRYLEAALTYPCALDAEPTPASCTLAVQVFFSV